MAVGRKPDLEPLLPPGRHILTLGELYDLAVHPFANVGRDRRKALFWNLERLIQELSVLQIACDAVVNGSFLTIKDSPSDIDVKIYVDPFLYMNLSYDQSEFINKLNQYDYIDGVDVSCYPLYYIGDPMKGSAYDPLVEGEPYGLEHGQFYLKGYVTIPVCETNVGLRIRR